MGLDITIHRKNVPYGSDFWVNGRRRYGDIVDLMKRKYNYQYGEDLLITWEIHSDLVSVLQEMMLESMDDEVDYFLYNEFYHFLCDIMDDVCDKKQEWYFEATW